MVTGWISLHRQLLNHDLWVNEPFTKGQAFVDLLLLAKPKGGVFMCKGFEIKYNTGEVTEGVKNLALRWKWSRNKVTNFLSKLEHEHTIGHRKGHSKNGVITLISITNYGKWQKKDTGQGTLLDTHNNYINKNNNTHVEFDEKKFLKIFNSITNKHHKKLPQKVKGQINARLKEGYSKEDIVTAIKNCATDTYHIESKYKYLTPEFITRPDKLDRFLNAGVTVSVSKNDKAQQFR